MQHILQLRKISTHNPSEVLCIPTCIKNILDNQFKNIQVNRHTLNRWCRYDGVLQDIMGVDALEEHFAPKLLEHNKIKYFQKQPGKISDLVSLLSQGIFTVVIFKLEDFNKWKKQTAITVERAGSTDYHALIVCGFDSTKEIIYLYDPIFDRYNTKKYKSSNMLDLYDQIRYPDFSGYWDKGFNSFMFWFEESASIKREKEKHKTLDNY